MRVQNLQCRDGRNGQLPNGIRRLEEEYYEVEENIYIQITMTAVHEVRDINLGNNHL
jgi:hypothetical protein